MSKSLEILQKYWNHDAFRTPQEEIINAVLAGKDTFALLPTGGGKSVCYQIPGLILDGITLVISPLVALMKDQVQNLQTKGIKAIALTGGIPENEIIDILDNCLFGNYKFLYLSPERLQNDWIFDYIKKLPVNLIAVDEAHCISIWGNDFRPAYLKISVLKDFFSTVPFLALTATATSKVQDDILFHLQLKNPSIFKKSFARENLAYMVFETENKLGLMEQVLQKNKASSIIYVNNRKACLETVFQLESMGFTATFYHGGLSVKDKTKNMNLWMNNNVHVMVATNAFGMGIDKPDVKTVIHLHLPQNLENYYQEVGRAGRNGEKAFGILIVNPSDVGHTKSQFLSILPDKEFLILVYKRLCSFFQIAYGEGIDETFTININQFCSKYNLPILKVYNAILFLDRQGIVTFIQAFSQKISLQFLIPSKEVIRYMSLNPNDEEIILTILRTYPGVYDYQTVINIQLIVKKSNTDEKLVVQVLEKLKEKQIIEYWSKNNDATLTFNEIREDEITINRVSKYLTEQNKLKFGQFEAVENFISNKNTCKSKLLLHYFGEKSTSNCGICSYCITLNTNELDIKKINENVLLLLEKKEYSSTEIVKQLKYQKDDIIFTLKSLLENDDIIIKPNNKYALKNKY